MSYHPDLNYHTSQVLKNSSTKKQIHSLTYFNKSVPKNIEIITEKLRLQCLDIYTALKPLETMGINFELWLAGGSVRDLLLGKSEAISDMDICISFKTHNMARQVSGEEFLNNSGLAAEEFPFPSIAWRDGDKSKPVFSHWEGIKKKIKYSKRNHHVYTTNEYEKTKIYTSICYEMLYCLLANSFELYQDFPPYAGKPALDNQYAGDRIDGVIKIRDPKWSWNCDILVTREHPQKFIDSFDFGICKVGVELVKANLSQYNVDFFPKDAKDFFLRMHFTKEFLTDVKAKNHVIRLENQATLTDIERSLEKHLPKISLKYDWPIVFKAPKLSGAYGSSIDKIEEKSAFVKAFMMKEKLQLVLQEKIDSPSKPKKI
jgi:hypothetical protein